VKRPCFAKYKFAAIASSCEQGLKGTRNGNPDRSTYFRTRGRTRHERRRNQILINSGFSIPAKHGRLGKAEVYDFKQQRHGKFYEQKRVEVIYTLEEETMVTVTVYVFYGKWEEQGADSV